MIILLISILVYLLSVIGWFFIIWHEEKAHYHTIGDVLDIVDEKLKPILKEIEVLSKQKNILEALISKHNEKCGLFHKEIELPIEYNILNKELL